VDCLLSSEPASNGSRRGLRGRTAAWFAAVLSLCAWSGCVTVKPQDKELLADPAMIYGSGGTSARQEEHVLENREAATSGSASGGGCGCN
jgi:Domain of unknown function (DUF4266)